MKRQRLGLIGLGAMGRPMATRLVELGFDLTVYNRTRLPPSRRVRGARLGETPRQAAEGAHAVITIVSTPEALRAVMLGEDGVLAADAPPRVVIEMSTVGRRAALALAKKAEDKGIAYVDAPVSGSVRPASRGELVALVGASKQALRLAKPVLDVLCRKVIHAGAAGAGQALKVVLNGIGAHHFVAFSSMLALGERAGLSRKVLVEAFTQGAFATPSYIGKAKRVLARDYRDPDFSLANALKDARLNVELQREVGAHLPVLRAILRDVENGVDEGLGDLDLFALEKHYNR